MKMDIFTLVIVLSITNLLQVVALSLQYRVNKSYKGVGWWLLGFTSMSSGYIFLFLRGIISIKLISIILANLLILAGTVFLYIGLLRFFDKKVNRKLIISIFSIYALSFFYYTYFNDYITSRTVIIYGIIAAVSFLTAWSIFSYKTVTVSASANFNTAIFLIQGCFFSFRSIVTLTVDPVNSLFTPTVMQEISFVFLFIIGILVTFGLIIMLNQRLNAENSEDKENLELIFNTSPDAVSITRLTDGHFVKINEIFTKFSGFSKEELIGKTAMEINIWKNPDDRKRIIDALNEKGFCDNMDVCLVRKDGVERYGILSARIFTMEGVPHFISVARDISDRKLAENLLEQTHQNYETFFNTIDDFLFVLDQQGNIIYVNATVIRRLGYTMEELYGKSVLMIHPPERREEAGRIVGNMLEGIADFCPVPITTKSGVQIPVETRVSHGFWDGRPVVFGVTKDVSKVRLSEEKFSKLFHINPSACGLSDLKDRKYIEVNEAFYSLLGFNENEVIGKTASELGILTEDAMQAILQKADSNGNVINVETELKAKNGDIKHVLMSSENINVQDKRFRFTVVHDITGRKQVEKALHESEEQFRLLVENSHDIIYTLTPEGRFTFVSQAWTTLLGHPVNQVLGQSFVPFVHPDDVPACTAWLAKVIETGERQEGMEYRVRNIKGEWCWHTSSAVPLRNEAGIVIGFEGTARDITDRKMTEQELKEREEQLRNLFLNAPVGIFHSDWEGHFLNANPALAEMLGYSSPEELIEVTYDMTIQIYAEHNVRPKIMELLLNTDGWIHFDEIIWKRRDNSLITIDMVGRKVLNEAGEFLYLEGFIEDITDRKIAEETLRKRDEQIRSINNNMQSGMIYQIVIEKNGSRKFTYLSDSVRILYGITPEEGLADPGLIYSKVHKDDVNRLAEEEETAIETFSTFKTELRTVTPSGDIRWAYIVSIPKILEDGSICFDGIEFDITDRKQAEEALRDSEEKLSTLFGSMTEMVVLHELVFDESGNPVNYRLMDCNRAFTGITGIRREEAVGKLATELYQTETAPYLTEYSQVALTGKSYEYTTYFEPMDKHFSISVVSPKKNHFATITTDITGVRKIQEEIFAKNEELENYLYIASHDLRSPLVNIQGFSRRLQKHTDSIKDVLLNSPLPPGAKADIDAIIEGDIPKSLNYIFSSVTKMDTLLNGLLHLSRTGRTLMTIKQVDINQLFNAIIGNFNFQLTEIDAVVEIADLPPCYGDVSLLSQLFSNVIGNAVKYRESSRQLKIEISAHQEFRKVIYSIRDNGLGIDSRHLEKIWDIFYRVDSKQSDAGEGLGLSIVKRIAEKHKGKVRVESEPGAGSIFYVELQKYEFSE